MHEMSMNFDMENVEPFLKRISAFIENGFSTEEIKKAVDFTSSLDHDNEKEIEFKIRYQNKEETLIYRVFMDDIDAPDICFFMESESLADAIGGEYEKMCEELGI